MNNDITYDKPFKKFMNDGNNKEYVSKLLSLLLKMDELYIKKNLKYLPTEIIVNNRKLCNYNEKNV